MSHITIKFNGGNPVVLCDKCRKIIRYATSDECLNQRVFPAEYCNECIKKIK